MSTNHSPFSLFNELGISLAKDSLWIGFSHEIEFLDGTETRKYGWKVRDTGCFQGIYARIWIGKYVLIMDKKGFKLKKKEKWALKFILGFEFKKLH